MDDTSADQREIVISRRIGAPRRVVFEACSAPEHLDRWWGPNGFTTTTHSFEFRPGGVWEFTMRGPDGTDYPNHIEWLAIDPPERIVMRHGSAADDPEAFEATITFREEEGATEVELRSVFATREQRDRAVEEFHAVEGGRQTLAALAEYVEESMQEK